MFASCMSNGTRLGSFLYRKCNLVVRNGFAIRFPDNRTFSDIEDPIAPTPSAVRRLDRHIESRFCGRQLQSRGEGENPGGLVENGCRGMLSGQLGCTAPAEHPQP